MLSEHTTYILMLSYTGTLTIARVKKKFQWTPYSLTCSWYSTPQVASKRAQPSTTSGITDCMACRTSTKYCPTVSLVTVCPLTSLATTPWRQTKRPTPAGTDSNTNTQTLMHHVI